MGEELTTKHWICSTWINIIRKDAIDFECCLFGAMEVTNYEHI